MKTLDYDEIEQVSGGSLGDYFWGAYEYVKENHHLQCLKRSRYGFNSRIQDDVFVKIVTKPRMKKI